MSGDAIFALKMKVIADVTTTMITWMATEPLAEQLPAVIDAIPDKPMVEGRVWKTED